MINVIMSVEKNEAGEYLGAVRGLQNSVGWSRKASLRRCRLSRDLKGTEASVRNPRKPRAEEETQARSVWHTLMLRIPEGEPFSGQLHIIPALLLSLGRLWVGEQVSGLTVTTRVTADPGWS